MPHTIEAAFVVVGPTVLAVTKGRIGPIRKIQ